MKVQLHPDKLIIEKKRNKLLFCEKLRNKFYLLYQNYSL